MERIKKQERRNKRNQDGSVLLPGLRFWRVLQKLWASFWYGLLHLSAKLLFFVFLVLSLGFACQNNPFLLFQSMIPSQICAFLADSFMFQSTVVVHGAAWIWLLLNCQQFFFFTEAKFSTSMSEQKKNYFLVSSR